MRYRLDQKRGRRPATSVFRFCRTWRLALAVTLLLFWTGPAWSAFDPSKHDLENIIYLELKSGRVVIQTYPEDAPNTVARIKELVRQGFYNGLTFHRVIPDFMAQTGDPRGDGSGGSGKNLDAEFNDRHHLRGTLSMARGSVENSADSQFFIMLLPKFALDGQYTVWGRVIDGMPNVDVIKRGSEGFQDGAVLDPDKIVSMSVAADVDEPAVPAAAALNPSYNAAPVNLYPGAPATGYPVYPAQSSTETGSPRASDAPSGTAANRTRETTAPSVSLPSWPVEPPVYDNVFPPIPEGGYVPY